MLTTNWLVTLLALLSVGTLVAEWLRVRNSVTKADLQEIARWAQLGPTKVLLEKIRLVERGHTKAEVARLLGQADNPMDGEWFYYLDEHAGYVIFFDCENRVEAVNSWKS